MARVTVEDCLVKIKNPFELVIIASEIARRISKERKTLVGSENDKPTVAALKQIASGRLTIYEASQEEYQTSENDSL